MKWCCFAHLRKGCSVLYLFKKIMGAVLVLFLLLTIGFCGYYIYSFYNFSNKIKQQPSSSATALPEWKGTERVNILLLGVDKRPSETSTRSDSIVVISMDPVTKNTHVFSILRDSWVDIPGHKKNRINDAYAAGGPELMAQTVEELTGLPIQFYVVTDFKGFEKVVDAIGGVDINVEKDMDYKLYEDNGYYDIHLKKGMQHLDGNKALQYVRFRHDKLGDYTRTERQRKFLLALVGEMKKTTNILKVPSILETISDYIKTNMGSSEMLKLATLGYKMDINQIKTEQIPPSSILREKRVGEAQVIDPQPALTRKYIANLLNGNSSQTKQIKIKK